MKRFSMIAMLLSASSILISCGGNGAANTAKNALANNAAPATAPAANNEADVKKMYGEIAAALSKNDTAALDKLYGDDYKIVAPDGTVTTKAERLGAMKAGDLKYENVTFSDIQVNSYGDTAVALAKSTGKVTNKGKAEESAYVITGVFVKTKDGWRLMRSHLSPSAGAAKADDKKADADDKSADGKKTEDTKADDAKPDDK